ncbi:MAG TPA: CARDB domain-containing protein [Streptosporangiaceae bacterium]|nr:CARDB domain-containing protein [Streptosporangiaceae bacterium]
MRRLFFTLVTGLGSVAALTLGPAAATAATGLPNAPAAGKPDLEITKLAYFGLPEPPYLLIGHSGEAPRFGISVTTANGGHGAAGPSTTMILIDDGSDVPVHVPVKVGRLAAGKSETKSVTVSGLKPKLGFTEVSAHANWRKKIKESDSNNNSKDAPKIAVEAREWDVSTFEVIATAQGGDHRTEAQDGFLFRFDHYKNGFVYKTIGPIEDMPKELNTCTSTATKTVTHDPWAHSTLQIDPDLAHYSASVVTLGNTYQVPMNCDGVTIQAQVAFQDLVSFVGLKKRPKMEPGDSRLHGSGVTSQVNGWTSTYIWAFNANVPK